MRWPFAETRTVTAVIKSTTELFSSILFAFSAPFTPQPPDPVIIQRLTELAPRIYQAGTHCAGCNQPMATLPGAGEAQEVTDLLQNTDLLQMHGVPT
jgi:hypothetical protein